MYFIRGAAGCGLETTIYDALVPKDEETEILPLHKNLHNMDLLPSNIDLANAEQELIFAELRELRLSQVLEPIQDKYDFILIDCPPSLGILSHISLVAANYVLVPIQCQFKALKGTDSLLKTVARVRKRLNPKLKIAGFIPTMCLSFIGCTTKSKAILIHLTLTLGLMNLMILLKTYLSHSWV